MKRESVNTFSGGLTYDINPITTPNNVLTDGVNATFLTFNGDEMALQNDAGNTRILSYYGESNKEIYDPTKIYYKNALIVDEGKLYYCKENGVTGVFDISKWKEVADSVKLSEGFKPIGLKEHGGILYIVSHRRTEGTKETEALDEFEIGSYPSPGYKKEGITTDITAVDLVKVVNVEGEDQIVHRLGEFIQLSNSEVFPGDPYRITFSNKANLTINGDRKFYTFEFYLKPKEGDFIALKDIGIVNSLTPFYSDGVSFVPNNGSGKLFIKFELEDIDEFAQYSKIDGTTYYFPRLEFDEEKTFIEFDHFNVKHGSEIKLDAIEMEYTLTNSQTGEVTETTGETPLEFEPVLENISEEEEFVCKDDGENYFRVQTPDTTHILEYTFTPKNKFYNILFNNHIIKNSIDLSIDPLLWGNRLTYSDVEKGNFYFQSPDNGDWLIFKNVVSGDRNLLKLDRLWGSSSVREFTQDITASVTGKNKVVHAPYFSGRNYMPGSSIDLNYTPDFNYAEFTNSQLSDLGLMYSSYYRRVWAKTSGLVGEETDTRYRIWAGEIDEVWSWDHSLYTNIETGPDFAIITDSGGIITCIKRRTITGEDFNPWTNFYGSTSGTGDYYGHYLVRSATGNNNSCNFSLDIGEKINDGPFYLPKDVAGNTFTTPTKPSTKKISITSTGTTGASTDSLEGVISTLEVVRNHVNFNNKGKEVTLMKKATANFEGLVKPTTYDFKEAVLNTSDNLITQLSGLPERQSNIVFEGRAQKRYVLNNTSNTKAIPTLTDGNKYTLAFYLIAEGASTINIEILGNSYAITYTDDGRTLKAEVTTSTESPYQQTHNHDEVDGLYVNKIPIFHNDWYYSYVKYTFTYTAPGNLVLTTSNNTFEIAELTLKSGIIIPQAVQTYQDILHGKIHTDLKTYMYSPSVPDIDNNVLGKLYIPNTNYEIRGKL